MAADTATDAQPATKFRARRVRTPTVLQMEAVECGAAALGIVLAYHGRFLSLEQLRIECGVSRDGSKASNMVKAARRYGLAARGLTREPNQLRSLPVPMIVFWNFSHFVVVEGFRKGWVYLNDPASGPRTVSDEEFDESFTGVVLVFEPTPDFKRGGEKPAFWPALVHRLRGSETALLFAVIAGLALVIPGLVVPVFSRIFVDEILLGRMNDWLRPLLIGMALTAVVRALLMWMQQSVLLRLEAKTAISTSSRFLDHILKLPMEFFHQRFPGEIGARLALNDKVAALVSRQFATTIINIITMIFYAAVMVAYDAVLTLFAISFVTLNLVALQYISRKRVDENQKLQRARGQLVGLTMGGLQMMEDLKIRRFCQCLFDRWSLFPRCQVVRARHAKEEENIFLSSDREHPGLLGFSRSSRLSIVFDEARRP